MKHDVEHLSYFNSIFYIVKKRELRDAAPEGCCLTLKIGNSECSMIFAVDHIF